MTEKETLLTSLSNTPFLLRQFVNQIPGNLLKKRRKPGKWTIHENACHIAQAEIMIYERFKKFEVEDQPEFKPYLPGVTISDEALIDLDLESEMDQFEDRRKQTVELLNRFNKATWNKIGFHNEYNSYTPFILLRHTLMHEYLHMYRMEELWLTKEAYL